MHQLVDLMTERIATSLQRQSVVSAAKWAEKYRVMGGLVPGPWSFRRFPWLKSMHESDADENYGQKAAQMGFTETVLNIVLYYIDIHNLDCLYVLPSKTPDASDFSSGRFDTALELSKHIRTMFSNVKNIGHKRAGNTNLYIRGAKSRAGLKSIPVAIIILDEIDEMDQTKIPLARERQSGQDITKLWGISTPTIEDEGINAFFKQSTQNEFFFKCPACSRSINLTWPESIEIIGEDSDDPRIEESFLKCNICNARLSHKSKPDWLANGRWIPKRTDKNSVGWGISQLYSTTHACRPGELVKSFFKAQVNPADEQEFFNSKLGVPHTVDGASVNENDIEGCVADYTSVTNSSSGLVTMGVDVGTFLHFEIDKWNINNNNSTDLNTTNVPQVLAVGKLRDFEQLDELMYRYNIGSCVIDMQPERRKAFEFASRYWGRVYLCTYARGITGKQININREELSVSVDRTSWLDLSQNRFKTGGIRLPRDLPREYKRHIMSLVRIYEKDSEGNPIGRYVKKQSSDDHFAHSRNYSEIALPLAAAIGQSQNLSGRL